MGENRAQTVIKAYCQLFWSASRSSYFRCWHETIPSVQGQFDVPPKHGRRDIVRTPFLLSKRVVTEDTPNVAPAGAWQRR